MKHQYTTAGTCSKAIEFEIEDGKVRNVSFKGGCHGNTQGICALVDDMDAHEAVKRLSGIQCGLKGTSCPDQLARAIEQALGE